MANTSSNTKQINTETSLPFSIAFEKLEFLERQANDKDGKLERMKIELDRKDEENYRLSEEVNLFKGRCANLQRDIQLSSSAMNKQAFCPPRP